MFIINKAARLIDFNFDKVKYRLMPAGAPVDVPQKAMDSIFLKALIADGSIEVTTDQPVKEKPAVEQKSKDVPVNVKTGKGK